MRRHSLLIDAVVVAVAVVIGIIIWTVAFSVGDEPVGDDPAASMSETDGSEDSDTAPETDDDAAPVFAIDLSDDSPYEASGIGTGAQGSRHEFVILRDADGSSMFSGDWGQGRFTMYAFADGTGYSCVDGQGCEALPPLADGSNQADLGDLSGAGEFGVFSGDPSYLGTEPCGESVCQVWQETRDDRVQTMYIDEQLRIKRIEVVEGGVPFWNVEYTYGPVTIPRPDGV